MGQDLKPDIKSDEHVVAAAADAPGKGARFGKWGKRFGVFAFCFFLIKGLAWLVVPAVVAVIASR